MNENQNDSKFIKCLKQLQSKLTYIHRYLQDTPSQNSWRHSQNRKLVGNDFLQSTRHFSNSSIIKKMKIVIEQLTVM